MIWNENISGYTLEEENKKLKQECEQLNRQLKRVNEKLKESEKFKSNFIANVTNELINPFTSIVGLSKTILSVRKEQWKRVISMVALIHAEAFDLDFQLRNLFYAAKIESGDEMPESIRIDVIDFLNNLKDSFKYVIKKKKLTLEINNHVNDDGEALLFKTDPDKLKLILTNLIKNAITFSYENQVIEINTWVESEMLKIAVRDYGRGISKEQQKEIFDRFKRLDNSINSIDRGNGLGLSVVKSLLEILNGEIEVESEPEAGATFIISIPENEDNPSGFAEDSDELFFEEEEEIF